MSYRSPGSSIVVALALKPDSQTILQAKPRAGCADLPEELLVSIFHSLRHPRDLLACACVCKAWRHGESKAFQPVLLDLNAHCGLDQLMMMTPIQLAAVRDARISFCGHTLLSATASVMILTFICRSLPRLQQLMLDWGGPFEPDEDWSQVGCTADAWCNLQI